MDFKVCYPVVSATLPGGVLGRDGLLAGLTRASQARLGSRPGQDWPCSPLPGLSSDGNEVELETVWGRQSYSLAGAVQTCQTFLHPATVAALAASPDPALAEMFSLPLDTTGKVSH